MIITVVYYFVCILTIGSNLLRLAEAVLIIFRQWLIIILDHFPRANNIIIERFILLGFHKYKCLSASVIVFRSFT